MNENANHANLTKPPLFHYAFLHSCSSLLERKWERIITGGWNRHSHFQKALTAWKRRCVLLPRGIRQSPCIITIQCWHTQDMLTQQYSQVGEVAIMPTPWQEHNLEELPTGAWGMAVGFAWHLWCWCNECVIDWNHNRGSCTQSDIQHTPGGCHSWIRGPLGSHPD